MTQAELKAQMIQAMKSKDEVRLSVMRGLLSACTNELVSKGRKPTEELAEDDVQTLVRRAAKQRKDSIEQFVAGGRQDLADKEKQELTVLEELLPAQMVREEVEKLAQEKATTLGISDKTKANQLMGALMKDLKGKADGTLVKDVVDKLFV